MKRFLSSILFVLMACFSAFSQSEQNCVVKEYNDAKKKTPLAGVEIVVNNAGSNVSAKNGKFVLSFRTLKPGDKVEVRKIEKDGYETFNKDALDAWRIANDGSEFTIVLCKRVKFKALKDQYNAVASKSYAQQQKKDEQYLANLLKEGKLQQAEYEKKLKELKDRYDEQLENLDNYIDRFARIDLETISKEEQKIIEMVKEGKIEEAIAAYESMNLEEKYAQAVGNVIIAKNAISQLEKIKTDNEAIRDATKQSIYRMNDTYRLVGGNENYEKIGNNLRVMAFSDSTDFYSMEVYADFLFEQKKHTEALQSFLSCYQGYNEKNDYVKSMRVAVKVGLLYENFQKYDEAKKFFDKAFLLANDITDDSLRHIQKNNIYNDMSKLYSNCGKYQESLEFMLLALNELEYFQDNNIVLAKYQTTCNNITLAYRRLGDIDNAKIWNAKSIEVARQLLNVDSNERNKEKLYNSLFNMGNLYLRTNDLKSAETFLQEAYNIIQDLYMKNPQHYLDDISAGYYTLGQLYYRTGCMDEARELLLKCKDIREKQSVSNADVYEDRLINIYNVLGNFFSELHDNLSAETYYLKALSMFEKVHERKNNTRTLHDVASVEINLGLLYKEFDETEKCILYLSKAFEHYCDLYDQNPKSFQEVYVGVCYELTLAYQRNSQLDKAQQILSIGLKKFPTDEDFLQLKKELMKKEESSSKGSRSN